MLAVHLFLAWILSSVSAHRGFWGRSSLSKELFRLGFRQNNQQDISRLWTETGTVPNKVKTVPPALLQVEFPWRLNIQPNSSITTQLALSPPTVSWHGDHNKLYTLIVEDNDVFRPDFGGDVKIFHWLVVNIPGCDVRRGDVAIDYLPLFSFDLSPDTGLNTELGSGNHRFIFLLYEQSERYQPTESVIGCSENIATGRVQDHDEFAEKYNLKGPIAGNFVRGGYAGDTTNRIFCRFTKCTGEAFPIPLPGINDGPECQGEVPRDQEKLQEVQEQVQVVQKVQEKLQEPVGAGRAKETAVNSYPRYYHHRRLRY